MRTPAFLRAAICRRTARRSGTPASGLFFPLLFSLLPLGCTDLGEPLSGPVAVAGTYKYKSYDSSGTQVARGFLTLAIRDSAITGNWSIQAVGNPTGIGPQTGSGELIGAVTPTHVWVELQPGFRDNNLQLVGTMAGREFTGRWTWISFIGPTASGPFEAEIDDSGPL